MAGVTNPEPGLLSMSGELDLHEVPQVREQLFELLSSQPSTVLLDLSDVSYVDSSGLALLIEANQRLRDQGRQLALCGLSSSVYNVFEIALLDEVFQIADDRTAALACLEH